MMIPLALLLAAAVLPGTQAEMNASHEASNACYRAALAKNPDLHGLIPVRVNLDERGTVIGIERTGGPDQPELLACLVMALQPVHLVLDGAPRHWDAFFVLSPEGPDVDLTDKTTPGAHVKILLAQQGGVRGCEPKEGKLSGFVAYHVFVEADGRVSRAKIDDVSLHAPEVVKCMNAKLAGLRFPPIITGRPLEIRLPMGIGVPPGTMPPGK